MTTTSRKIDSLQALRAFAAIVVMLFHGTEVLLEKLNYIFLRNFFMAGFSGVQIFFVLSGFIIFYTSYSKGLTIKNFLIKRFVRIYPVHTLVVLSLVVLYFISPSPEQAYRGDPGAIVSSLTLIPFAKMVLGPSWTLCHEVIFYLIFAFTYLINKRFFYVTLTCWTIVILAGFAANYKTGYNVIDTIFDIININFILGCLLALIYINKPNIKNSHWVLFSGLLLFSAFWALNINNTLSGTNKSLLLYFGLPTASVVLVSGVLFSTYKIPRLLTHLGDASFSLYLLHFPLLRILLKIFEKIGFVKHTNNFVTAVSMFVLTIIISSFFYRYVESNLLKYTSNLFKKGES